MRGKFLMLIICAFLAACGSGSSNSNSAAEKPMTVGALMTEYKQSKEATKSKYTGKTLTVGGVATSAPIMPNGADDEGVFIIGERGGDPFSTLTCWFKQPDKEEFSKITANETVILRGVFEDSISTGLKECKIVKIE